MLTRCHSKTGNIAEFVWGKNRHATSSIRFEGSGAQSAFAPGKNICGSYLCGELDKALIGLGIKMTFLT